MANNIIFDDEDVRSIQIAEDQIRSKTATQVPVGYIPMELSSHGQLGAPKTLYVKNFSTLDLVALSQSIDEALPKRVIETLNGCIYDPENKNDVANWTEQEVIELLVRMYANFYSRKLMSIPYEVTEEDKEFLRTNERLDMLEAVESGKYKPTLAIDLTSDIQIKDIDPNITGKLEVTSKDGSFKVEFSIPKIGDALIVKKVLQDRFGEQDMIYEKMRRRRDKDEIIPEKEMAAWNEHITKKSMFAIQLTMALYISSINGSDLRGMPLEQKLEVCKDPRLDEKIYKKAAKTFDSITYGIQPEIDIINPITNQKTKRRFSFRLMDILQAIQLHEPDEYVVSFK